MKSYVETSELTNIGTFLYEYLRTIDVGAEWHNEYLEENEVPCIAFKKEGDQVEKLNCNIKGGYEAEMTFAVYYRDEVRDTNDTLNIVEPLNYLASIFKEETDAQFPLLDLKNDRIKPIALEMTHTPQDYSGVENNKATFVAYYKLTYKKKGDFE